MTDNKNINNALSDDELDQVAGGVVLSSPQTQKCPECGTYTGVSVVAAPDGKRYCNSCLMKKFPLNRP